MAIVIDGTGSITGLSAGGLPDASITAAELAAGAARSNFGAGAVLQVVQGTTQTQVTVSVNTYTDIGLSATITPSSTSNKIMAIATVFCYAPGSGNGYGIQLLKGSTIVWNPSAQDSSGPYYNYSGSGGGVWSNSSLMYVDSPASTSSLTYKIQGRPYSTSYGVANFQNSGNVNGKSSIILLEIAG